MKFALPKNLLTGARWDILTVLLVSLTGMVGLIYAVIFAYPQVVPMPLQVPTKTPVPTSPAILDVRATRPFPTFPAEWTAVFATRHAQSPVGTPTPLALAPSAVANPITSSTLTLTTDLTVSPIPSLPPGVTPTATLTLGSPVPTLSTPIELSATATLTPVSPTPLPSPETPLPTDIPGSYPTWIPWDFDSSTSTPYPPGYPGNQ
jgi:hypothetical protein